MKKSLTTLCYLEKDDSYLMLHRVKKEKDVNKDKWIGVGGHAEDYESPEDCLLREVFEETGLKLIDYRFRGIITFSLLGEETQYMCLYTATKWEGELIVDCREGVLSWVPKTEIKNLELWTGDKVFFDLLNRDYSFFSLKLTYEKNRLLSCVLDGKELEYLDIVDEAGEPTGDIVLREFAHRNGILHRTSHVWIARHKAGTIELLVQKRSADKDSHPGCYDISSAGHIPAGDSFTESAVRELKEELGLFAEEHSLYYCGTRRICWRDTFHGQPFYDNLVSNVYLYWADPSETDFLIQESEIESVCWKEISALNREVEENTIPNCISMEELKLVSAAVEKTKSDFLIERAWKEDLPAILSIEQQALLQLSNKDWYVTDDMPYLLRHVENEGFILKAVSPEGKIVSFLTVRYPKEAKDNLFYDIAEHCGLSEHDRDLTAHLESVAVDPDYRGYHLQRQLLEKGIEIASKAGYRHFCSTVHPDNLSSRKNLEAAGLKKVCEKLKYGGLPRCIYHFYLPSD